MATNDANLSFSVKLPYKQRCVIPECQRAVDRVYRVNQDGHPLNFCSNDHARLGITRWEEKKKLGIKPGQPQPAPDLSNESEGDNLMELDERG